MKKKTRKHLGRLMTNSIMKLVKFRQRQRKLIGTELFAQSLRFHTFSCTELPKKLNFDIISGLLDENKLKVCPHTQSRLDQLSGYIGGNFPRVLCRCSGKNLFTIGENKKTGRQSYFDNRNCIIPIHCIWLYSLTCKQDNNKG